MKTSELLWRAEQYLWDGHGDRPNPRERGVGLCHAIELAAPEYKVSQYVTMKVNYAQTLIRDRLGKYWYYADWAVAQGFLPAGWRHHFEWWPVIQANRLNWLRALQREFAEKGD